MEVIVTGGSGFIGQHLCQRLAAGGHHVLSIQRRPWRDTPPGVKTMEVDIRDVSIMKAFNGCEILYHLAAIPPGEARRRELYEVNVRGTENVLDMAYSCRVRRVVFVSSAEVYGLLPSIPCPEDVPLRPLTEYGRSKALAETCCLQFMKKKGMAVVILRPGSVLGPGVRVRSILFLFNQIIKNRPLFLFGRGRNKIQLLSVHDLVDVLVALEGPDPPGPLNVAGHEATPLIDLGKKLKTHARSRSPILSIPSLPFKPVLSLLEALGLWPSILPYMIQSDKDFILDITKAKNVLGFDPHYSNIEMLLETFDWYLKEVDRRRLGGQEMDTVDIEVAKAMKKGNGQDHTHDKADHESEFR